MDTSELDSIDHHYASVLIVTKSGTMVGQQRDDKPGIDQPGKIGFLAAPSSRAKSPATRPGARLSKKKQT